MLNHEYFNSPNLENSYVAGFIAADGNIWKKNGKNRLSIDLQARDYEYLKNISALFSNKEIKITKRGYPKLEIFSKQIVSDLERNFSITENKSLTLKPPKLEGQNALAFIIGNLDGDGSIIIRKDRWNELCIQFLGTLELLDWIKNQLSQYCDVSTTTIKHYKPNLYTMRFHCSKAKQVYSILNRITVPKMARKWNRPELEAIK